MQLPPRRRWLIGGAGGAVLLGLLSVVLFAGAGSGMTPLARGMSPEDQAAAVAALEARNIAYELGPGGSILVSPDAVYQARLELAMSTLPSGRSVGFELFDESEVGQTAFVERVNYHRALEGELTRTIRHLAPVERARVHLVVPRRRLFEEDQEEPSASVVVSLRQGGVLADRQVQAIRQLVSGAVEGLSLLRVAVVDSAGRVYARADDPELFGTVYAMEGTLSYERQLEERVVRLLEPVVGVGRVRAQVAAELDFSKLVETRERYDPDGQVLRSEREQTEKTVDTKPDPKGPPGTASNLPDPAAAQQAGAAAHRKTKERLDHTRNYEIDKSVTRKETPHPRVQKLSIAVLVDAPADKPRSSDELAAMTRIVSSAVGLDPARGDSIEIDSQPFRAEELGLPPEGADEPAMAEGFPWLWVAVGVAALALLVLVWVLWLRRRVTDDELERVTGLSVDQEAPPELTRAVQMEVADLRSEVERDVEADVRVAVTVLRSWLGTHIGEESEGEAA